MNYSPLRYPGGKSRLSDFIRLVIKNLDIPNCTYVEPFAGGAGVALTLLLEGAVERIVINDYDKAIYSFWRAVKDTPEDLIDRIIETPITMAEWYRQREIYAKSSVCSLDLAFATFFLNRTNHSGILNAGPIGGYSQAGKWKLNVRFNKEILIGKIRTISERKEQIEVYNKDILDFLQYEISGLPGNLFFYFDPPYYHKGQKLYKNFFEPEDHRRIHDAIAHTVTAPWIITYDNDCWIADLYNDYEIRRFDLTYSAANKGIASELMIFSNARICPLKEQMIINGIHINLRE